MVNPASYIARRQALRERITSGLLLFPGNGESPMNYAANQYPFRQDSTFLYFFGLDVPDLAAVIDADTGEETLFGNDPAVEDIVWMGPQESLSEKARCAGVEKTLPRDDLADTVRKARLSGRRVHYLPQYRGDNVIRIQMLLGLESPLPVNDHTSIDFIRAVAALRSVKSPDEVTEIESALAVSGEVFETALAIVRPGLHEYQVAGALEGLRASKNSPISFPMILTVNGEVLHGHSHGNLMKKGDLLVIDAGAESPLHYSSDITRTLPVGGAFTSLQRDLYDIVLSANVKAIGMMRPGVSFRDVHLAAATAIAEGMKGLGFMKGDTAAGVEQGAHALFFPHGLGHLLGLDVHDLENLGEEYTGYDASVRRSSQFGLSYLRYAKNLLPGIALSVEPGIYFMPELIRQWRSQARHVAFINYPLVEKTIGFGGIRIEDDVLITETGARVLGKPIAKTAAEIEKGMEKARLERKC